MIVKNKQPYYSVTDVAHAGGCRPDRLWHRIHETGHFPEPSIKIGRRRYYDKHVYANIVADLVLEAKMKQDHK